VTDSASPASSTPGQPVLDTTVAHSARVWNFWLGGKDNFEPDRELGDQIKQFFPEIAIIAQESRRFLARAVTYLAGEVGIRQFLDIGTGLPTANNTHEVAQRVAPDSRIVYVDNDPLVLVHARALLTSTPEGATEYLEADLHDPDTILRKAAGTLDFTRPVAVMLLGILAHVPDYDEARSIVDRLVAALPSGSYLVVNDGTNVIDPEARNAATQATIEAGTPYISRHPDTIAGYFHDLELIEPGVVSSIRWRAEPDENGKLPDEIDVFCGVGRKP